MTQCNLLSILVLVEANGQLKYPPKCKCVVREVQRGVSDHSQGFEDKNLGSSPALLGQ